MKTYNPVNTLKVATAALTALAEETQRRRSQVYPLLTLKVYTVEIDLENANVKISRRNPDVESWTGRAIRLAPDATVEVTLTEDNAAWNIADKYISNSPTEAGKKAAKLLY